MRFRLHVTITGPTGLVANAVIGSIGTPCAYTAQCNDEMRQLSLSRRRSTASIVLYNTAHVLLLLRTVTSGGSICDTVPVAKVRSATRSEHKHAAVLPS